jgi:hypothetical protein
VDGGDDHQQRFCQTVNAETLHDWRCPLSVGFAATSPRGARLKPRWFVLTSPHLWGEGAVLEVGDDHRQDAFVGQ